ncbi:MAG TPA: thioredoxin domain-containing protein [Kofleriaceae bacterium]|nr:thioredoxin domain-containing protein [Kofleriaceae bacterium]
MISSRLFVPVAALALALPAAGCQRESSDVTQRLDRIEKEQKETNQLLRRLAAGGGGRGAAGDRKRHDPAVTYAIPVEGSPSKGPADAPVTVVEAFEYACPACESARGVMDEIAKAYPNDVRVVYRTFLIHPQVATIPAQAGCAANKQGKFSEMSELIWDKGFKAGRNLTAENMEKLAGEAGLDAGKFKADMNGDECQKLVSEEHSSLAKLGVGATPSIFVNGRPLQRRSPDQFKALIDEELAKAKQRIAQGTKQADYYKEWVLEKGTKKL